MLSKNLKKGLDYRIIIKKLKNIIIEPYDLTLLKKYKPYKVH